MMAGRRNYLRRAFWALPIPPLSRTNAALAVFGLEREADLALAMSTVPSPPAEPQQPSSGTISAASAIATTRRPSPRDRPQARRAVMKESLFIKFKEPIGPVAASSISGGCARAQWTFLIPPDVDPQDQSHASRSGSAAVPAKSAKPPQGGDSPITGIFGQTSSFSLLGRGQRLRIVDNQIMPMVR
jgi:hypothetical protein